MNLSRREEKKTNYQEPLDRIEEWKSRMKEKNVLDRNIIFLVSSIICVKRKPIFCRQKPVLRQQRQPRLRLR